MKKLTKLLARFTLFSAAECAILFGLPALATRHPFILLAVSLSVLILTVYAIHKPAAKPKAAKHRTATHSTSSPNFPAWNSTVPALMMASPSSSWNKPTAPMIVTTVSPSTLPQPSAPTKSPRILPPRAMSSPGPSSALLPKTKKMPAIGPPLTASLPTANMIWNAAIITDVQLFALACYNVWLYNPIINQTAKQNYFSVFTKLFKSKSA